MCLEGNSFSSNAEGREEKNGALFGFFVWFYMGLVGGFFLGVGFLVFCFVFVFLRKAYLYCF